MKTIKLRRVQVSIKCVINEGNTILEPVIWQTKYKLRPYS